MREGKLTPALAGELRALASRDIGILAISILMSFGAIAVAASILALNPTFATGTATVVAPVVIGLAVLFGAGERAGACSLGPGTVIGALLLWGGAIGALDAGFHRAGVQRDHSARAGGRHRRGFLMAVVPLTAGALGSSTGYFHATYMPIVTEPTITIVFFAVLALAVYLVGNRVGPAYEGSQPCLPACRWSWTISGSGSARCGATIRARAGRLAAWSRGRPARPGKRPHSMCRTGFLPSPGLSS